MSRLSPALKSLINAPFARSDVMRAPHNISHIFESIAQDATARGVGVPAWLCIAAGTTVTLNSPDSFTALYDVAIRRWDPVVTANLMREVGLKCIGFNGIPRTINTLNTFVNHLPETTRAKLVKKPTRGLRVETLDSTLDRGRALWKSIYHPFHESLIDKLALGHPDLPAHIVGAEYGGLFSDAPDSDVDLESTGAGGAQSTGKVGRVLTSLVAIACLRAQTGAGPQLLSHVYGLRKAYEDGTARSEGQDVIDGGEWLAGNEGSVWILRTVDGIVEAFASSVQKRDNTSSIKAKL